MFKAGFCQVLPSAFYLHPVSRPVIQKGHPSMECMSTKKKLSPDSILREIKRKTRRKFLAEEKTRIILEGLRSKEGDRNGAKATPVQLSDSVDSQ